MSEKIKEQTPTRTALEKYTDEEGVLRYGVWGWLQCQLKAQEPHDSSRRKRKLEKDKKHKKKEKEDENT